jgi:hypothetical protein
MTLSQSLQNKGVYLNKRGQIEFDVTTLGLTAEGWKTRLEQGGHKLSDWAKDILSKPDFDRNHRYEQGQTIKVFLIRGVEIKEADKRTTQNLQALATKQAGEASVTSLKGELALLIREKFTNEELREMGLWYIAVLHTPIVDSDGGPYVLYSRRDGGGSWVNAYWVKPGSIWGDCGAFAFVADLSS